MPRGSKQKLSPDQQQDVLQRYGDGQSVRQIAAVYEVSYTTVVGVLKRNGVARRERADYAWKPTPENRAEVARLFRDGLSVPKIARHVGTGNDTVSRVLREEGINARYGGQNQRFKSDQIPALIAEYDSAKSLAAMAKRHECSTAVIRKTLQRAGVEIAPHKSSPTFWTTERRAWLDEQLKAGRDLADIAAELGRGEAGLARKARALGIVPRQPHARRGANHAWKGGRTIDGNGYVRVRVGADDQRLVGLYGPYGDGYVLEHRLVMARTLGRPLLSTETVHHINGNKQDNSPENLQLRQGRHGKGVALICMDCGSHRVEAAPLK